MISRIQILKDNYNSLRRDNENLEKENANLRAVLKVIADDKNWSCDTDINDNYHEEWVRHSYPREIAAQALKKSGEVN